jgi:hypothetical protein
MQQIDRWNWSAVERYLPLWQQDTRANLSLLDYMQQIDRWNWSIVEKCLPGWYGERCAVPLLDYIKQNS